MMNTPKYMASVRNLDKTYVVCDFRTSVTLLGSQIPMDGAPFVTPNRLQRGVYKAKRVFSTTRAQYVNNQLSRPNVVILESTAAGNENYSSSDSDSILTPNNNFSSAMGYRIQNLESCQENEHLRFRPTKVHQSRKRKVGQSLGDIGQVQLVDINSITPAQLQQVMKLSPPTFEEGQYDKSCGQLEPKRQSMDKYQSPC